MTGETQTTTPQGTPQTGETQETTNPASANAEPATNDAGKTEEGASKPEETGKTGETKQADKGKSGEKPEETSTFVTGKDKEGESKTDADESGKKSEGEGDADPEPITYEDFTLPENVEAFDDILGGFKEVAGKHKLSQDAAQEMIDLHVNAIQRAQDQWQEKIADWAKETSQDSVVGGHNLDASVETTETVLKELVPEADQQQMQETLALGVGNQLWFIRLMNKIDGMMKEAQTIGDSNPPAPVKSHATMLFGNSTQKQ